MEPSQSSSYYRIRRLIEGEETKAIVKFLRENPKSTVDKVAKHLQKEKICSRLTTLSLVEKLLVIGLIRDDREGYFHSLSYNEDFDFRDFASALFKSDLKQNFRIFQQFVFFDSPTEDQVKELHKYLDEALTDYLNEYHKAAQKAKEKDPALFSQPKPKPKKHRPPVTKNRAEIRAFNCA